MLRVVSLNMNGARAAFRKGLRDWLAVCRPDIVCVQELKAQDADLSDELRRPAGLRGYFSFAQKRGYSGVGIYAKRPPQRAQHAFGDKRWDDEGRFIRLDYAHYSVVSLYIPSGSSGDARRRFKFQMLDAVYRRLAAYRRESLQSGRGFIVCGDFNIAHTKKDIRNWRANQKRSGFLPEERQWLSRLLQRQGWSDVFRALNDGDGEYTWWSNRGNAWANNVGWRIDYQIAAGAPAKTAKRATIYKAARFSDHAPLLIDYAAGKNGAPFAGHG